MNHKDSKRLSQAVEQYLLQRIEQGYPDTHIDTQCNILQDFHLFVERQSKEWDEIFTLEILKLLGQVLKNYFLIFQDLTVCRITAVVLAG